MDTKEYSYELLIETRQNAQSINSSISFLTEGLNTNLKCTPRTILAGVKAVEITSVQLPANIYNVRITSDNNIFKINDGKSNLDFVVPIGTYGCTSLASKLQELLKQNDSNWTFTFNIDTVKFTITKFIGPQFTILSSNINFILGFENGNGVVFKPVSSFTSPSKAVITYIPYCFIMSDKLLGYKKIKPIYKGEYKSILSKVPVINVDSGIKFTSLLGTKILFPTRPSLTDFDIRLTSPDESLIDLNGYNWSFTIRFYF